MPLTAEIERIPMFRMRSISAVRGMDLLRLSIYQR